MIPDSFIQELLARVDVADVVGRYVTLRKAGANLLGLCPFHSEKTPSFTVSPNKQFYHCFGCGAHGSAISFLIEHTGATFPEAVQTLAASVGLSVPHEPRSPAQQAARKQRQRQTQQHHHLLDTAQAHYQAQLKEAPDAIAYLKQRGLSGKVAAYYGLGWSGGGRQALSAVFPEYDSSALVECGLVIEADDGRRYDRFRDRITFPIRNVRGHIVGFGGRLIRKGEPKYLNSPETPLFQKGRELYGLYEARQAIRREACVLIVEGYMDVVGLACHGIDYAVATLGTATTADHIQRLLRSSNVLIFSFDGDRAGQAAAWRALEASLAFLRDDVVVRFLFLPDNHDPDSYCQEHGVEAFREALSNAVPLSRYLLDTLSSRHAMDEAEGRAACVHDAKPLLAKLPDGSLRIQIERELADRVRLTPDELSAMLAAEPQHEPTHTSQSQTFVGQPVASEQHAAAQAASQTGVSNTPSTSAYRSKQGQQIRPSRRQRQSLAVIPMAKRLLRLLLTHPELITHINDQQLEMITQSPNLKWVRELIVLMHSTQAHHTGALLQAVEPDSELAEVLRGLSTDLLEQDELPSPQAEWDDALARIELELVRTEQSNLIASGLTTQADRERYQHLSKRLAQLRGAPAY